MSFTKSTTDISVHQKLGDYPNQDNGMTADELKKKFDYPAETLQKDLNKIVEELENENATQSIGASKLDENDETENNVQAKLDKIYQETKNVTLGQIPDGTITEEKLDGEYANSLAKKENLGLMYLSGVYNTPLCENVQPIDYTSPALTSENTQGYTITLENCNTYNISDIYTMLGGDGESYITGNRDDVSLYYKGSIKIAFPEYAKLESIYIKTKRSLTSTNLGNVTIKISEDDINYVPVNYNYKEDYLYEITSDTNYYKYIQITVDSTSTAPIIYNNIQLHGKVLKNLQPLIITTPSLTSENKQGYTVTIGKNGSTNIGTITDAYTMLGGNGEESFMAVYNNTWLIIEFPSYFKMTEYKIAAYSNYGVAIYGSNDGQNYTKISELELSSKKYEFITLNNNSFYKYYKIQGTNQNYYNDLYNSIYFKGQMLDELVSNSLIITDNNENKTLNDYIDGMIVRLKMPSNYFEGLNLPSQLKIYNLEYKKIPKDLKPNKYYTLVYKNSEFVHESEV